MQHDETGDARGGSRQFGGIGRGSALGIFLLKNSVQTAPTDFLALGAAAVPASGAMRVNAASFGNDVLTTVNATVTTAFRNSNALAQFGTTSNHELRFIQNNTSVWAIGAAGAGIAAFNSVAATARSGGGATNGLSVRNSANTFDTFNVSDAGSSATLNNNTRSLILALTAGSGELRAGGYLRPNNTGDYAMLRAVGQTTGGIAGLYFDGAVDRSAWEVSNVAAGFGILDLMRSGGTTRIGNGAAYGAGVASLDMRGLTNGAGVLAGTLLNSPVVGNPTFWMPIMIAGVVKHLPCW